MIGINNLSYRYPGQENYAIVDITLTIGEREFLLVAGPSGAGKSTLLRCLNGLIPHYSGGKISGDVSVDEIDVIRAGPKEVSSTVGFVFQDPEAQNVLDKVEDELAFGLENAAVPQEEMGRRITEVLSILELDAFRDRQISTLSGGERQRVAIASVLVLLPRVIVLDEPTSQLDPLSANQLLKYLVRLNQKWGVTVILTEHRLERISHYATRIVYLEEGRITLDESIESGLMHLSPTSTTPLARLSHSLGWKSTPLSVRDARTFLEITENNQREQGGEGELPGATPHPGQDDEPILQAKNLHFSYDGVQVLKGVHLFIKSGERIALIGRNGSGKSTLLRCLVGLLKPLSGDILLNGESIRNRGVAEISRSVAFLPQNPTDLLFAESVMEELEITLRNHGLQRSQLSQSPEELLTSLGLADYAESYPRDLSVGEKQRAALGSVIVTEPELVLLDEPTRGLDYAAKRNLLKIWRRWRDRGTAFLLVTHDVELVSRSCDRVLFLDEGRIIADGPVSEVLDLDPVFRPQLARLFPGKGYLTVTDALHGLKETGE